MWQKTYTRRGGHRTYLIEVGTPHVPYWGGDTAHTLLGVGTPHNIERKSLAVGGWVGGGPDQKIMPLCGSILQAETCQILRMRIQDGAESGNITNELKLP